MTVAPLLGSVLKRCEWKLVVEARFLLECIHATAGDGRSLEREEVESTMYFPTEQLTAQGPDPAQVVGIKVRGDSMDGTLADGD